MPREIQASFKIVTPMFLGDAEQKATGIRPPSIKGALRFWWRAFNWGRFIQRFPNEREALRSLHAEEAKLFGAAADGAGEGQGCFLLAHRFNGKKKVNDWPRNQTPSGYLGFGLWESGSHDKGNYQPHREALAEEQQFDALLRFRPRIADEDVDQIKEALIAFGLLGGLGSRVRRGFGSVAIQQLNSENMKFSSKRAYLQRVKDLIGSFFLAKQRPPYTALSQNARLVVLCEGNNARAIHAQIGTLYKNYRGQPGGLRGAVKKPFGLPLKGVSDDHRASPLLMHIHPVGISYLAVALLVPAIFHPQHDIPSYKVVEDFLAGKGLVYPWATISTSP
jgi:CRISPR-associated protein Cmr1